LTEFVKGENGGAGVDHDLGPNGDNEEHERIVVLYSNTIIDPRAMMVESLNAMIADGAVTRSCCFYHLAFWAEIGRVDVSQ
jgi:hypothetical protein